MARSNTNPGPAMRRYIVAMLMLAAVVSYIDRQMLSILLEPIKHDLKLSDSQLGLLSGLFFSGFFIVAGIPLARLSDRGTRRSIIGACMIAWSAATAACGVAQNYVQIAIARAGVAIGEAGCAPATGSLIADLFSPRERARIFALISCGSAIGIAFGIYLAGSLNEHFGWRAVFYIIGLPGVLIGLLFLFTVPEPRRPDVPEGEAASLGLVEAIGSFAKLPSYRYLIAVAIFASASAYAVLAWMPAFLIRVHGMSTGEVGWKMGTGTVIGLLAGNLLCGHLAHKLGGRDPRWLIWLVGVGLLACIPSGLMAFSVQSDTLALIFFTLFMVTLGFWSPPVTTIAIGLVDSRSRALVASTMPLYQAVGGAIGPSFVGMVTDWLAPDYGPGAVRYALLASLVGCAVGGVLAIIAGRSVGRDYRLSAEPVALAH